jgi:hypothetical protein
MGMNHSATTAIELACDALRDTRRGVHILGVVAARLPWRTLASPRALAAA